MSLREKAVKGVVWSAVQNWGSSLVGALVFLILANLLDAEAFGLLALAAVFSAFLAVFQRQGFIQAIIQRADLTPGHLDTAFWISSLSGLALAAGFYASADLIARICGQPALTAILQWLAITVFIEALGTTPRAILRRRFAFKSLAIQALVASTAGGIVGVGMAVKGFGVWSLVGQQLVVSITGTAVLWAASRWRPGLGVSVRHSRDLFGFGVYAMGNELVAFFNVRTPDLLIGTYLGTEALGYYTVGHRLLLILTQLFTQTVRVVALPVLSRLQHDPAQMRQALLTATRMTSLLAFPAFLGAAALAPELVLALFGEKWERSIPIMQILAFMGIVRSVTFFNTPVIIACGKPAWAFVIALTNAVANVVVISVAVRWGIVAVAGAFVIRGYVFSPLALWAVCKLIRLDPMSYLRQFAAPLGASLGMVLAVMVAKHFLLDVTTVRVVLPLCILIGGAVYSLTVLLAAPVVVREALELLRVALPSERWRRT